LGITSIEVDPLGRAKKITDNNGKEVEYTFGAEGERRSIKYPDGKVAEYLYDDSLRLKTLIDGENKVDYFYDSNSRLSSKIFSSGVSAKYSYNDMGMLSELTHSDKSGTLDKFTYTYDNMVNKTGVEKYRRGLEEESGKYSFTYDPLSRLTEVHKDGEQIKTFGYDGFGNRSFMSDNGNRTNYTYNSLNQLISTVDSLGAEQNFSYDKRGNLTQIIENGNIKNTYEFGTLNRLTKAVNANGHTANYDYNGLGFRIGKQTADNISPTKHISYVLDLTKQYHNQLQMNDGTASQNYIWDSNIAFADGNTYLQDELGSPLRYIGSSGGIIDSYGYGEFGDDLYGNQGKAQPFGYTGYTTDSIAATYFAQAREYVPHLGRFAGEDSVKGNINEPMTLNAYTYCWNQPLSWVDLDGLFPTESDISETQAPQEVCQYHIPDWFREHWGDLSYAAISVFQRPLTITIRDVTVEVNDALSYTAQYAFNRRPNQPRSIFSAMNMLNVAQMAAQHFDNLSWFYSQMTHRAPWDIKVFEQWQNTIGTEHPGRHDSFIRFRGQLMTPESLGNWTFGYIGAALGISVWELLGGSWYADGFSMPWTEAFLENERLDWNYIIQGFIAFNAEDYRCQF
jgi:RHS repeat-associated protein